MDNNGINATFPTKCQMMIFNGQGAKEHLFDFGFKLQVHVLPDVSDTVGNKFMMLRPNAFEVLEYWDEGDYFCVDRFMKERIKAYAKYVYGDSLYFEDSRLTHLNSISVKLVSGTIKFTGTLKR